MHFGLHGLVAESRSIAGDGHACVVALLSALGEVDGHDFHADSALD